MSQQNPIDFDIIRSVFPMDEAVLKAFDAATVAGLLKTAKKKLESDAEGAVLTPIVDAIKSAGVDIPIGFRVVIDQTDKGELSVSLRKKKTSSGSSNGGNRGKQLKVTKGPKIINGKTFSSGAECVRALNADNPEKFPIPAGEFSAPQRLKSWGIDFEYVETAEDEKGSSSRAPKRKRSRAKRS